MIEHETEILADREKTQRSRLAGRGIDISVTTFFGIGRLEYALSKNIYQ